MEKKTYTVYKYDELNEEQKEKAIERYYDINIDHDWWDHIETDDCGIKLKEFDIDRGSYCKLGFEKSELETARAIVENHGESCNTHRLSRAYIEAYESLERERETINQSDDDIGYRKEVEIEDKMEVLKDEYVEDLQNEYLQLLRDEYSFQTERVAIEETLRANDYDFTEDGKID